MKIQRTILTVIAIIILLMCANSIIIEGGSFLVKRTAGPLDWVLLRPEKTETELNENLLLRELFFELKGAFNRIIDKHYVYGLYKHENGHFFTAGAKTKLGDKLKNLDAFSQWCNERGISLLYVNLPGKGENRYFEDFGVESFTGKNADEILSELSGKGIDHMDMRDYFSAEDIESLEIYFKTDHHWKISSGLFTAQILSKYINDHYHLGLDRSVIEDEKMHTDFMPQSWVGEYGRRTSIAFSGKDDFEYITPVDPGSFHLTIPVREMDVTGGFPVMINDSVFKNKNLYHNSYYYAYLYGNDNIQIIDNLEERSGRILLVKDSFAQAVAPFLAMTADELTCWDVRNNDIDLREYLSVHPVDLVVIMYTESALQNQFFVFTGSE